MKKLKRIKKNGKVHLSKDENEILKEIVKKQQDLIDQLALAITDLQLQGGTTR